MRNLVVPVLTARQKILEKSLVGECVRHTCRREAEDVLVGICG